MPYVKVFGQIKHFYNEIPASAGQIVKIKLIPDEESTNDFDSEAIYLVEEYSVVLKANGFLPDTVNGDSENLLLWCNVASKYQFTTPDNKTWEAIVSYGDGSPKNITEIRAGGVEIDPPDTINSLIDSKAVRFDQAQTLTNEQKVQARENIGIEDGGSGASELDELSDVTLTSPANDDFLQRKSGVFVNRTIAQVKTDLGLTGTNSGDETVATIGSLIDGATAKTTPVNADTIAISDSAASGILKKLSFTNLKTFLKTYFDTLYQAVLSSGTNIKTINGESVLGAGDLEISGGSAESPMTLSAGDEAETPLTIEEAEDQTAPPFLIKSNEGDDYLKVEPHGYNKGLRIRGGYADNGVKLNEGGIFFLDTGNGGELSIQSNFSNNGPYFTTNKNQFAFNKDIVLNGAVGASSPGSLGIKMQSPNGTWWKLTVTDAGTLEVNEDE